MHSGWPRAVARRIGLGGEINFTTTRIGVTLHVPCRGWGKHAAHVVDVRVAPGQNPEAIAKKLLHEGWRVGHRLTCPDARKKKEAPMPNDLRDSTSSAALIVGNSSPTPAAGRARRLVYMALEEYYDEAKKAYKPGHSDANIAKECGVAEALVKTIREESYGPLAVPSDLIGIKQEIDRLTREAKASGDAFQQEVTRLLTRLDNLVRKNNWAE